MYYHHIVKLHYMYVRFGICKYVLLFYDNPIYEVILVSHLKRRVMDVINKVNKFIFIVRMFNRMIVSLYPIILLYHLSRQLRHWVQIYTLYKFCQNALIMLTFLKQNIFYSISLSK